MVSYIKTGRLVNPRFFAASAPARRAERLGVRPSSLTLSIQRCGSSDSHREQAAGDRKVVEG
jgi:hypothetical protein